MNFVLRMALSVALATGAVFLFNLGEQQGWPLTAKFIPTVLVAVLLYFGAFSVVTGLVGRK